MCKALGDINPEEMVIAMEKLFQKKMVEELKAKVNFLLAKKKKL